MTLSGRPAIALVAALLCLPLYAGCTEDDASRPGFPRTPRTPIAGSPIPFAAPEEVGLASDDIWWLKERLYSRVVARHVIGAEILVIKDNRIVLHQAMGWADRDDLEPLARNTIFRLASMTKPFVGTAALMLVDQERLGLEDPVADYLESFDNERSGVITIRQLLTHRSGFVQGGQPAGYGTRPSLREAVDLTGETGPDFVPGNRFIYSNLNSDILGAVVEEITGEPVERFIEKHILNTLGLEDTYTRFAPDAPWAERVASSYRRWGSGPWERYWHPGQEEAPSWFSPAGDMLGTAVDYARFLSAWMDDARNDGGRLLSAPLARQALADPAPERTSARSRYFGMHWEIYAAPSGPDGLPVYGHRGATGTVGMVMPQQSVIVVFLTNAQETEVVEEVIELALRMFGS